MAAAAQQTAPSTDPDLIRFPPFPPIPPDVKIVPFKDYKETGIKLICPKDGIEVDGQDIPTVRLEHKHTTDKCKTNALQITPDDKKGRPIVAKKRKSKASAVTVAPKKWWEIWQDEEAGKFTGPYNLKTPIDRLIQAATDFRTSRTWPKPEVRTLGVDKLWDQFGVFIGLHAIVPAWIRAERMKAEEARKNIQAVIEKAGENAIPQEESDDDGDISDEEGPIINQHTNEGAPSEVDQEQSLGDADADAKAALEERETAAIEEEEERKVDRILAFLIDPEKVVQMFLSSYMRKEGLIWSDPNLFNAPRLLSFFLRFVLRNKLLPQHEDGLKKALAVTERGQKELPESSVIAKLIPCEVGLALRDQFGSKAETFQYKILSNDDENTAGSENAPVDDVNMEGGALEEAAVEYVGNGEYVDVVRPVGGGIPRTEKVVEGDEGGDRVRKKAKLDGDVQEQETAMEVDKEDAGGWGSWDGQASWGETIDASATDWSLPVYSLSKFLGMDALPATHTTGVVEESVRKIISVYAPSVKPNTTVDALETQLESKLGRVVLAPWNEWDVPAVGEELGEVRRVYTEIYRGKKAEKAIRHFDSKEGEDQDENGKVNKPKRKPEEYYDEDAEDNLESTEAKIIWENSRGWVVDPSSGNIVLSNCTRGKPEASTLPLKRKAYDPHKDTIEVIVDPAVADKLKSVVGMGLGGTFVQLVRKEELTSSTAANLKAFWYMEDLKIVIPSFYTS